MTPHQKFPQSETSASNIVGTDNVDADEHIQPQAIKTMRLYSNTDRIEKEFKEAGFTPSDHIDHTILSRFDSMHYLGNSAVQCALDIKAQTTTTTTSKQPLKVLDVGSGFGGPARYMAVSDKFDCSVIALELQTDIHKKAVELTSRCNLSQQITHVNGDILKGMPMCEDNDDANDNLDIPNQYDLLTSWLVFLHISEKDLLHHKCAEKVKAGGAIYIEDFFKKGDFSNLEEDILQRDVFCDGTTLLTREGYIKSLEEAGFENITFVDMTKLWTEFVNLRKATFISGKERYTRVHGLQAYESLLIFYGAMTTLFDAGNLGGVRVHGTKKY